MAGTTGILLVEDNDFDARVVQRLLGQARESFQVERVSLLEDCLARLQSVSFDLVLLDLGLPDSAGGLDALKRTHEVDGNVPIIVFTGLSDEDVAVDALREGAQDYVVKEALESTDLLRSIRYARERVSHAQSERQLLEAEEQFRSAREIQQRLFPDHAPEVPGYDLAGHCIPADATGGDYYDFIPSTGDCSSIGLVMGDVSGHGLAPAMLMTAARAVLRTLIRVTMDPLQVITQTNEIVSADMPEGRFITLLFAAFDPSSGLVTYSSAGHDGYLFDSAGNIKHEMEPHGLPINLLEGVEYDEATQIRMEPGDILLLYTDGIPEAMNAERKLMGKARMLEVVKEAAAAPAESIVQTLFNEAEAHRNGRPQTDDVTALVVKRNE